MYYQLGICKHCERIIRAFVPSAANKPVSQISEQDLKKIKYLLRRGSKSKAYYSCLSDLWYKM